MTVRRAGPSTVAARATGRVLPDLEGRPDGVAVRETLSPRRIVVGVDGTRGSRRALAWALEEARARPAALELVRAWSPGEFATLEEMEQRAVQELHDLAHEALGDDPGVDYSEVTVKGRAARVLADRAAGADMLVVGSEGHGRFAGLLLDSVGQSVASHAEVPAVVIVKA